jgi:hypothetical protein
MSADNYIFVDQNTFEVYNCVASCVCQHKKHCLDCQKGRPVTKAMNFEKACKKASEIDSEYGIFLYLWCK